MEAKKLTDKEEEVMQQVWQRGPLTIRQMLEGYEEPKPHFNTISTFVHILEEKGYLDREKCGNALVYSPAISIEEYRSATAKGLVKRLFNNSAMSLVSSFVKDQEISVDELREIIDMVERQKL